MKMLNEVSYRIFYSPADDPLKNFYIPALSASVQYDRSAGFFSSTALAVAAEGVAHLIQNGGRMRLLVGAELSEKDVEAIRSGHDLKDQVEQNFLSRFPDPQDALLKQRLEVMAWMVAAGTLEIKVVIPRDTDGIPIPASLAQDYYHPKTGIFTDAEGNQMAFQGSVNESETGWLKNYETFSVMFSWDGTKAYLAQYRINFERLWNGQEPDWIALDIPKAVTGRLLKYRPEEAPVRDPLEKKPVVKDSQTGSNYQVDPRFTERVIFQFLRDAPHLLNADTLGAATSAIAPWAHQIRVADEVIQKFPDRALLSDEVGLGKTIEAGLIIRQLWLSGKVQHCLILAPRSVLKQWQEELYEKFALRVPLYDGARYWAPYDEPLETPQGNPWEAFPILIAGSQLAKRAERRAQILDACGWDLLVVDEAHHARRKDFKDRNTFRPNRLLSLINDLGERNKFASLLLMTATPMQVHPVEVWDLLKLLGLGARWGADENNFLHFFAELQKSNKDADWEFLLDLVADHLRTGGRLDEAFVSQAQADLGLVQWETIQGMLESGAVHHHGMRDLKPKAYIYLRELARRHTPLQRYLYRNTRSLLREYQRQGILKANVPNRKPKIVRVQMTEEEFALYERVEEYISHFYQKYEAERRGLGFIMTVYRRRLTSSFYAIAESLERRYKFLTGKIGLDETFDDDDLEQDELSLDLSDDLTSIGDKARFQAEIDYLKEFIHDIHAKKATDSKLEHLKIELADIFKQRPTVLIFTQYADTLDNLREELRLVYGSQVACYSGRGGEVWNGIAWVQQTKEKVKLAFKNGEIRILLATESASEGLNLQTCGVLINYDMPWNPMRVEQRIGRIDRIGQQYKDIWVRNYFYQDTIEDIIYQRLSDRINWFEVVVGDLQPILAEVGEVTRRLAMLSTDERQNKLDQEITQLRQRLQNREVESLNLDEFAESGVYRPANPPPVTLLDLQTTLTTSTTTSACFQPHPTILDAYLMLSDGKNIAVTFSPAVYDEHPSTVQFLTYGNPLLEDLLHRSPEPGNSSGRLVRYQDSSDPLFSGWYWLDPIQQSFRTIPTLGELQKVLEIVQPADDVIQNDLLCAAEADFQGGVAGAIARQSEVKHLRSLGAYLAERDRAQRLLIKATLVELALGRQPALLDTETYPAAFNEQAVSGLARHGFPWGPLIQLAYDAGLSPAETDPYYMQIQNANRDSLKGRFNQLTEEARKAVRTVKRAKDLLEGK